MSPRSQVPTSCSPPQRPMADGFISVRFGLFAVRQISELFGVIRSTGTGTCHCGHKRLSKLLLVAFGISYLFTCPLTYSYVSLSKL